MLLLPYKEITRSLQHQASFLRKLAHTSAKAPSVAPCSVCTDPQLISGTLQIMAVIGVGTPSAFTEEPLLDLTPSTKRLAHLMIQSEATDGKEERRKRIKAVSRFLLRGCQNRH